MRDDEPEIRSIPVDLITVLNPRARNKRVFQELVDSIAHLGLKKPITVSKRPGRTRYDLVCGQGRLEAFIALGQTEIPALVVEVSQEDCFVMSLVENLARRQQSPLELVHAIGVLAARGYSHAEIAKKVDFSVEYVAAICVLLERGEEKLISALETKSDPTFYRDGDCTCQGRRGATGARTSLRREENSGQSSVGDPADHRATQ
jgi:ParB family transcriptional regulator, chromosome partitioning protein